MSQKELSRLSVIEKLQSGQITQVMAGTQLNLSDRQIRRLLKNYRKNGTKGLMPKKRGKPSNNKISETRKQHILQIAKEKYPDFGPTFLREKLLENHNVRIGRETLRKWLIEIGLWQAKRCKKARIHQSRKRRSKFGELVQIDGSPHDWFEGRRDKCCLLVFVDDATSSILNLRFEESETTVGYLRATRAYIEKRGLPMAFYNDKHSVFRSNMPNGEQQGVTQFARAMSELGIEIICANSPQAKGRVERINGILQDRLVKELRLLGIRDIETANAYLPKFIEDYNKKFAVAAKSEHDAHVKFLGTKEQLDLIFSIKEFRVLSKNLELSYKNTIYQIKASGVGYGMRHARVTVCKDLNGEITILYRNRRLDYSVYQRNRKTAEIVDSKELNRKLDSLLAQHRNIEIAAS